jgi:U3 small nucleolar RNA-associated protein 12
LPLKTFASILNFKSQLFLEEERERELDAIYSNSLIDTVNTSIGSGNFPNDVQAEAEIAAVRKQTTETLMAGERIMEALDLADAECLAFKLYEEANARATDVELQPPQRNPVLAAYDLEPEEYVFRVVEKVKSTALEDALLVLPFSKVVSLMGYLNIWAQRVKSVPFYV